MKVLIQIDNQKKKKKKKLRVAMNTIYLLCTPDTSAVKYGTQFGNYFISPFQMWSINRTLWSVEKNHYT